MTANQIPAGARITVFRHRAGRQEAVASGIWDGYEVEWEDKEALYYETRYHVERGLADGLLTDTITSGDPGMDSTYTYTVETQGS